VDWLNTQVVALLECFKNLGRELEIIRASYYNTFIVMKIFLSFVILLIALLQYRLWFVNGGIEQIQHDQLLLVDLKKQVEEKRERNAALYAEVEDLRKGQESLEERARKELGMIRDGETFFQVLD
jgi:cell division protein FtsB